MVTPATGQAELGYVHINPDISENGILFQFTVAFSGIFQKMLSLKCRKTLKWPSCACIKAIFYKQNIPALTGASRSHSKTPFNVIFAAVSKDYCSKYIYLQHCESE